MRKTNYVITASMPMDNGEKATPKTLPRSLKIAKVTPSSNETEKIPRKRLNQTMDAGNSSENGKFVRVKADNVDANDAIAVSAVKTPRRSTRKFAKLPTPSFEMPPPKSSSRRRKTTAVVPSSLNVDVESTIRSSVAHESSGTNGDDNRLATKKRRTAKSVILANQIDASSLDANNISEPIVEIKSRQRKSRAIKSIEIDAGSNSETDETVQNERKRRSNVNKIDVTNEESNIGLGNGSIHEEIPSQSVNHNVDDASSGSTTETDYNTADQSSDGSLIKLQNSDKIVQADKSNISGIHFLNEEQNQAKPIQTVPLIDLTDSLNGTAEQEHILNVTFSPIKDAEVKPFPLSASKLKFTRISSTPKVQLPQLSSGKKPMKRLSKNTPRFDVPKEQPRSTKSRGTPYVRRVAHANMPNIANTKVFGSTKKEKIADGVKKLLQQKRVTFNSPKSVTVNSPKSTTKSAAAAAKTPIPKSGPSLDHLQASASSSKQKGFSFSAPQVNSASGSAVKIPNFASIHKKMFDKFESIDETVVRRQQRHQKLSERKENKGNTNIYTHIQLKETSALNDVLLFSGFASSTNAQRPTKPKTVARRLDNTEVAVRPKEVLKTRHNATNPEVRPTAQPDKAKVRLERHQEMFKGRQVPTARTKRNQMLKGVRLNRRFELQMQFRGDNLN